MFPSSAALANVGVTGLAVMGSNLARNLVRHGHVVAVHNRSVERTTALVDQHGSEGRILPSETVAGFVASLQRPRRIIVMVEAGGPTDAVRAERPPASLVQGLRDNFGAHTHPRVDSPGTFHTHWSQGGAEVRVS